ncbi:hypothetical protein D3C72_1837790 [compost metagenome]
MRNTGLAQEVDIQIAPFAAGTDAGQARGQFTFERGQRPAGEQRAGGEAARGHVQRHPVGYAGQRRRRSVCGGACQRLRQHLAPARDTRGRPFAHGRVRMGFIGKERFREHGGGIAAAHPVRIRRVIHDAWLA